jgi:hypothetical protein
MYYSRYILINLSFCLGYHENHFESNFFYSSTILDHLLFLGGFGFFKYLKLPEILEFMRCVAPMCQIWVQCLVSILFFLNLIPDL